MEPKRIIEIHCEDPHPDAMGRLVTWAIDGYDRVDIYGDKAVQGFVAHYTSTTDPKKTYTIGAVWREEAQEFTFHS